MTTMMTMMMTSTMMTTMTAIEHTCKTDITTQAAGDIYIHSLLADLQTAETEGAELQVGLSPDFQD